MSQLIERAPRFSSATALMRSYAALKMRMANLAPPKPLALPSPEMMARGNKVIPMLSGASAPPPAPAKPTGLRMTFGTHIAGAEPGRDTRSLRRSVVYTEVTTVADIIPNQISLLPKQVRVLDSGLEGVAIGRAINAVVRMLSEGSVRPSMLVRVIAESFRVQWSVMLDASRCRGAVRVRQIAAAILSRFSNYSLPEIGRALGGRDHTTILHAIRKMEWLVEDVAREGAC